MKDNNQNRFRFTTCAQCKRTVTHRASIGIRGEAVFRPGMVLKRQCRDTLGCAAAQKGSN